MRSLSPALQAHIMGELTTLCYLVKITRVDGVVRGLTSHDRDVIWDGITFVADGAFSPGALTADSGLGVDHVELEGILDAAQIDAVDLDAGRYDRARVDIYLANWQDLSQGAALLRRGFMGEVRRDGSRYTAELRGMQDLLQRQIGDFYTAECRHDLGDDQCAVNLAALTVSGSVTQTVDTAHFIDHARTQADDYFRYGALRWLSGANVGLRMEIKSWSLASKQFALWLPMPMPILVGDSYEVTAGCDKRLISCRSKFNNVVNFGGFPHLPGVDRVLRYPDSKA